MLIIFLLCLRALDEAGCPSEFFSVHYVCSSYRECERLVYMKDAHLDVIKRSDAGAQLRA